jgi:hypothetical protein
MDEATGIVAGLLGAASVGDGPTAEQRRVIDSLAHGYLGVKVDLDAISPLEPDALAAVVDTHDRHRVIDLLVLVEFCRHPDDPAQADRVDAYVARLGHEDMALVARDVQTGHRERVMADWARFGQGARTLAGVEITEVGSFVHALANCRPGTLGRGLHDFYASQGLPFPGDPDGGDPSLAYHDFTHVLTGYGTTPPDEVALQAMLTAAAGFDHHFSSLVASLALFEAAAFTMPGFVAREAVLDRPGAADELADAFRRGDLCTGDISQVDFIARKDDLLADVRAEYNIEPAGAF